MVRHPMYSLRKNTFQLLSAVAFSLITTPATLAVPGSDFDFFRAENIPTSFHTTTYENELTGNKGEAFQDFVNIDALTLDLGTINSRKLDSSQLKINFDKDVIVYFINEGAHYRNSLSIKSSGTTNLSGFVFDDVSCLESGCVYPETHGDYTLQPENVLQLGDYVSVGTVQAGSRLDFQLKTRRFDDYSTFFQTIYTDNNLNSNNQGVIAYEYEGYLILAWEDAHDGDYNDLVFVIDIGQDNLDCIPSEGELADPNCSPTLVLYAD